LAQQEQAVEVHLDDPPERVDRLRLGRAAVPDARVVHEDLVVAVRVDGGGDEPLAVLVLRDVAGDGGDALAQLVRQRLEPVGAPGGGHDGGAGGVEDPGEAVPEPARRARDDGDAAVQAERGDEIDRAHGRRTYDGAGHGRDVWHLATCQPRPMKVRIGYGLGPRTAISADRFAAMVGALEELRFDSLWLSERVTGEGPDPVVGLAVAAGMTRRLKLGFSVLVLPGRNPMLLATELATLDRLSGGRLLPAFGLGAVDPAVQHAFGVAREERAARFDEVLPLLHRFWSGEPVDHDGRFHRYEGARVGPTPTQDHLDVWLGGRARSELRRCGRLGDGWLPSFCTPDD